MTRSRITTGTRIREGLVTSASRSRTSTLLANGLRSSESPL
ncbi:hypothetical protein GDO78_015001 [Eleutherodactylus coqui]|uniref:Uncharacterized protein n=1 Tax=Eleutherodactylus coqui TaxID=57060 RepID=A0A8J6EDZ6_ELECQ|nr:hypothetical protein GDO78_015001 [Eleutherodactylus coqui]